MSEEMTPRRRRVRQEIPQEETPAAAPYEAKPQSAPIPQQEEAPRRIVIASEDEEPEWMVSAGKVSGAAVRRTGHAAAGEEAQSEPAAAENTKESEVAAINRLKKGAAAAAPRAVQAAQTADAVKPAAQAKTVRAKKPAAKAAAPKKVKKAAPKAAVQPTPKKKLSKKARARRAKKIRNMVIVGVVLAVIAALTVTGVVQLNRLVDIKKTLDRGDGVFYPNIFVNNIPLEGRTLDEAASIVTQQVNNLIASWRITLRAQDGRTWDITGKDLKMSYDVADQLDQLWAIGHTGPSAQRYEQVKQLEEGPVMRYTTLTYDMSAVNQILTQIKGEVDRSPVSATKVYDENLWPPYTYTDDVPGQELDISGLSERIMGMVDTLESGIVDLAPTRVEAPITRAYLESQIVQLATYETSIAKAGDYAEARAENVRIGTEKFDKLIIRSGEQVSFNKVTGLRTTANGFSVALELAYGEYVEGVGGGICQVSSTLYYCTLVADLEIITRSPHSYVSSYMPIGMDATVSWGGPHFTFKNNTNYPIRIEAKEEEGYVKVKLIGTDEKDYYIKMEYEIVGSQSPGVTYREFPSDNPQGYTDGQVIATPYTGYTAKTYKVKYDKETDELISRDFDRTSQYKKRDEIIVVIVD